MIDERELMADLLYEAQYRHMSVEDTVDLLQDHGVIYPPCKVGDTVYYVFPNDFHSNEIREGVISDIAFGAKLEKDWLAGIRVFLLEEVGRNIFFDREEAERALRERELTATYNKEDKGD